MHANKSTILKLAALHGDLYFHCGLKETVEQIAKHSKRVYRFTFSHQPSSGMQILGAYHSADLPYVFNIAPGGGLFPDSFTAQEMEFSNWMIDQWVAFAQTGVPHEQWQPVTANRPHPTWILNETMGVVDYEYRKQHCTFWKSLLPTGLIRTKIINYMQHESYLSYFFNALLLRMLFDKAILRIVVAVLFAVFLAFAYLLWWCCCRRKATPKQKVN